MQKSLNEITEEDLQKITDLAALFFSPREIAIMLEIPADDFIILSALADSKIYNAFQSGRLQSEVDLRRSIIKLAKSGSSPAQTMSLDILKLSKVKMLDR